MKCNEAEKLILLQSSDELPAKQAGALAAHLPDCVPCQRFQRALLESAHAFDQAEEPAAKIVQNILREARLRAPEKKHARIPAWKPVLAMASSLAIGLGIFLSMFSPDKVGMVFVVTEAQLLKAEDQIVRIMYEGLSEDDLAFNFLMTYEES